MKKEIKHVCECENCGNEAEMVITCSLDDHVKTDDVKPVVTKAEKGKVKGQGVCSSCGGEADIWLDI